MAPAIGMSGGLLLHQLLLVLASAALGGSAVRLASVAAPAGLERVLAAFTIAVAGAVLEAIVLGLAGAGGDTAALTLAAVATYLLVRVGIPTPQLPMGRELWDWLAAAHRPVALGLGATAGVVGGWIAWQMRHPLIGPDALTYHLPIASAWVQNGRPGSIVNVLSGTPFGNYPLTNEVIVAWVLGISRSWVVVSVWSPVLLVAVGLGGWVALRELGVAGVERALAVVAICVPPLMIGQLGAPYTDIAALAWLAVAAGLASAARRRPALIYPAVLAGALCLGTKTTPAILVGALAVLAVRPLRAARMRWLVPTVGVAAVVGGVWAARNLIIHGSPLWPLVATPWGDPVPAAFQALGQRFLDDPRHLIGTYWRDYLAVLGGGVVLIGGGLALPLVRRSGAALAAAMAGALGLVAWGLAPYTGLERYGAVGAIANTRYLLPAIAACTLALAVSAVGAGRALRYAVRAALGGSIGYSVVKTEPVHPSLARLGLAAGVGVAVAALARGRPLTFDRRLVSGVAGLCCALGLAAGGQGYVGRYLSANGPSDRALYSLRALASATGPIASSPGVFVLLRGDRLEHPLALIGDGESCARVQARLRRGPVVLASQATNAAQRRLAACLRGVARGSVGGIENVFG